MAKINDDEENLPSNMFRPASGAAVGGGYGGGAAPQQMQRQSTTPGTGFRNLQDYLTGQSSAGELISGMESTGKSTLGKIGEFTAESGKKTAVPEFDPNVAGGWLYDVAPGQNQDKEAKFTGEVPAGYSGPADYTGMPNWLEASTSAESTEKKAGRLGGFTGIQQAIGENRGPVWTSGMGKVATVRTMADPRWDELQAQKEKWSGIKGILGQAESDVQGNIQRAQQNTQAWQNAAQMAQEKAAETNKRRAEIAANQGPGVYDYTSPAVVPAPAPAAPAPAPSNKKTQSEFGKFLDQWVMPADPSTALFTPLPPALSSEQLRRSDPYKVVQDAQGGTFYYIGNNPLSRGLTRASDRLTRFMPD